MEFYRRIEVEDILDAVAVKEATHIEMHQIGALFFVESFTIVNNEQRRMV